MKYRLLHWLRYRLLGGLIPEGKWGLGILGHRLYVGGRWDEMGKLQFNFIVSQGLKPEHCFLDVACGALRGGVHFIQYLNEGNYLGLDKEETLLQRGIRQELGSEMQKLKKPEFVISDSFEFSKFGKKPQYALALSLFTHLTAPDIQKCLQHLGEFVGSGHMFFATFFEGDSQKNQAVSHSLDHFEYSKEEMIAFGKQTGWNVEYIGDWKHPRNQVMVKYTKP